MAKAVLARQQVVTTSHNGLLGGWHGSLQVVYMQLLKSAGALSHIVQVHAFGTQRSETDVRKLTAEPMLSIYIFSFDTGKFTDITSLAQSHLSCHPPSLSVMRSMLPRWL